jgi:uncharacterized membrane protein YdjX (TVP38/TMEM64 family)
MAALGAVLGVSILDLIARRMGEEGLERFVSAEKVKQLKSKLKKRSGWAILVVSLLPPPFPFRPLIVTASALQSPRLPMLLGVFTGRLMRYSCEAILILYIGRRLLVFLESSLFEYVIYALSAVTVVGSLLTLRVWMVKVEKHKPAPVQGKPR